MALHGLQMASWDNPPASSVLRDWFMESESMVAALEMMGTISTLFRDSRKVTGWNGFRAPYPPPKKRTRQAGVWWNHPRKQEPPTLFHSPQNAESLWVLICESAEWGNTLKQEAEELN